MFFDGNRKIGAAFYGGVICHHHDFSAMYPANAGNDAGARRLVIKHAVCSERRQFQERRAWVEQGGNAVTRQQLAAFGMFGAGFFTAAQGNTILLLFKFAYL